MPLAQSAPRQNLQGFGDAHIVALAQAGSEAAFREIMRRNNRRLFRVARAVVRDAGEAEDVLQEAYLKAFAGLASFRGEASLSTWLTRITLNEALQRRRRQRETVELRELDRTPGPGANVLVFPMLETDNPEAAAARTQLRGLLERAVDDLPASFRLVFVMRDIEEMSIEETAAHLKLRPETVRTRLFRARRLLRKALHAKIASGFSGGVFPFEGARCARITDAVIARLAGSQRPGDGEP
jgi:RNA polymerase sigma-70 factor, ECF subfamily